MQIKSQEMIHCIHCEEKGFEEGFKEGAATVVRSMKSALEETEPQIESLINQAKSN